MDNNMLKIDVSSKAVETFIDAISRGIGVLYEPTRIRKEAKAKAEEKVILAKAEKQEREILAAVQPLVGDSVSLEQLQPVISKMISDELRKTSNPQPIGFRENLLVKRPKFFYCTYSLGITETS